MEYLKILPGSVRDISLVLVVDEHAIGLGEGFETLAAHEEDLNFGEGLAGRDVARLLQQVFEHFAVLVRALLLLQAVDVVAEHHLRLARVQHVERYAHLGAVEQVRFGPRHVGRTVHKVVVEIRMVVDLVLDRVPVVVAQTGQVGEEFQQDGR